MKYIIELEEIDDTGYYTVKDTNLIVGGNITKDFTPYTEPTEREDCCGCKGCKWFDALVEDGAPCYGCLRNEKYKDLWEAKPKKTIKRWELR